MPETETPTETISPADLLKAASLEAQAVTQRMAKIATACRNERWATDEGRILAGRVAAVVECLLAQQQIAGRLKAGMASLMADEAGKLDAATVAAISQAGQVQASGPSGKPTPIPGNGEQKPAPEAAKVEDGDKPATMADVFSTLKAGLDLIGEPSHDHDERASEATVDGETVAPPVEQPKKAGKRIRVA